MGLINEDLFAQLMTEDAEFASKGTPASNNPSKPFDAANSKEKNISVKGGTSERPTAKPDGGEYGPKPSGLSERPSSAWPERSIKVPSAEMLQDPTYNKALNMLQKSFESTMRSLDIYNQIVEHMGGGSVQMDQDAYTEAAICEAMVDALDNGPYFESLERSDKKEVQALVKKMRGKLEKLNGHGIKFYKPAKWIRFIFIEPSGHDVQPGNSGDQVMAQRSWFNTRMWSIVGAVLIDKGTANEFAKELNKQFADELGEYKFLMVKVPPTIIDVFRMKFGWKNTKHSYFILIDKKITADIKKAIASMRAADTTEKKGDEAVEESAKNDDKECDCGECEDCKKKGKGKKKKEEDDDDDDLKTEAAIDDFFAEGVRDKLKEVGNKAGKSAKASVTALVSKLGKLLSGYDRKLKSALKKYKAAKDSKDFQTMRSAKAEINSTLSEMDQKIATTASSDADSSDDRYEWLEKFAHMRYETFKDDPWMLNVLAFGTVDHFKPKPVSEEEFVKSYVAKHKKRLIEKNKRSGDSNE